MTRYRCTRKDPGTWTVVLIVACLIGTAYLCWSIIPAILRGVQ